MKEVTAESYTLRKSNGDWLAQIVITSDGMLAGVTDWGNFALAWRSFGDDFKDFILHIEPDYLATKIYSAMNFIQSGRKAEKAYATLAEKVLPALKAALK